MTRAAAYRRQKRSHQGRPSPSSVPPTSNNTARSPRSDTLSLTEKPLVSACLPAREREVRHIHGHEHDQEEPFDVVQPGTQADCVKPRVVPEQIPPAHRPIETGAIS